MYIEAENIKLYKIHPPELQNDLQNPVYNYIIHIKYGLTCASLSIYILSWSNQTDYTCSKPLLCVHISFTRSILTLMGTLLFLTLIFSTK